MQATLATRPGIDEADTAVDAVLIEELVKIYPGPDGRPFRAVDGVSLTVRRGEVLGILGPNGAGKTTTLEIVEGLTRRDSGRVRVLGIDPATDPTTLKQRIGVQLQSSSYFEHLRLEELLELFGSFYERRLAPIDLLARVGLEEKRRSLVGQLSGGQAQRFSLVAALVNDPDVVFLDEPTTGLDPQARRSIWGLVADLAAEGRTIVLTTHYMEEAEVLSDRVAVIDHGRIIAIDGPETLIARHGAGQRISFTAGAPLPGAALAGLPGEVVDSGEPEGSTDYEVEVENASAAVPELYGWAANHGIALTEVRIRTSTLEDVFLNLTGNRLRD